MTAKRILQAIVAIAALGAGGQASAIPVTFDLGASHVSVTNFEGGWLCDLTGCGATVSLNPNLGSLSRTLSAGESWTFDFFSIAFHGLGGGAGSLSATLGFDAPTDAVAAGSGVGSFFTAFLLSGGSLQWTAQPGTFVLDDGSSYSVAFENLSGIVLGTQANVRARLTLNNESTISVSEPRVLTLLGLALLALGLVGRRSRRKHIAA